MGPWDTGDATAYFIAEGKKKKSYEFVGKAEEEGKVSGTLIAALVVGLDLGADAVPADRTVPPDPAALDALGDRLAGGKADAWGPTSDPTFMATRCRDCQRALVVTPHQVRDARRTANGVARVVVCAACAAGRFRFLRRGTDDFYSVTTATEAQYREVSGALTRLGLEPRGDL